MRITGLDVELVRMPLEEPYATAQGSYAVAENVFVVLETERGVGLGCAAPEADVTGETAEQTQALLRGPVLDALRDGDAGRWMSLLEGLRAGPCARAPAALAAVDIALWDLLARRAELPLWKLLGGTRRAMPTSVTIGLADIDATIEQAERWIAAGFGCLKVKGGADVDLDIARMRRLRQAVGTAIELRFDANQGYQLEQALRFVEATRDLELSVLEQPTPRGQPQLLSSVTRAATAPVMADESLLTLRDAFRLARGEVVDMVNVKLMKVGGLTEAQHVASVARAASMSLMVGCMDESALAIAAGLAFALARPTVELADLDGHIGLRGDPFAAAVRLEGGVLHPHEGAGLGVAPP